MKKYLFLTGLIFVLIAFLVWKPLGNEPQEKSLTKTIKIPKLEHGDIILKNGKGIVSKKIVKSLGEKVPYSHLGIYYQKSDTAFVIHSVSGDESKQDGVQFITIQDFLKEAIPTSVCFVRRKTSSESRNNFAEEAFKMAEQRRGFDMEFNLQDSTKIYCTELAYWAFKRAGDSIELKTKDIGGFPVILFETLRNEKFFKILN